MAHNCHGKTKSHGTTNLTHGKIMLSDGKTKLTHGSAPLIHDKTKLTHGRTPLIHGKSKLTRGKTKFTQGKTKFTHGKTKFTHGKTNYSWQNKENELVRGWSAVVICFTNGMSCNSNTLLARKPPFVVQCSLSLSIRICISFSSK